MEVRAGKDDLFSDAMRWNLWVIKAMCVFALQFVE